MTVEKKAPTLRNSLFLNCLRVLYLSLFWSINLTDPIPKMFPMKLHPRVYHILSFFAWINFNSPSLSKVWNAILGRDFSLYFVSNSSFFYSHSFLNSRCLLSNQYLPSGFLTLILLASSSILFLAYSLSIVYSSLDSSLILGINQNKTNQN